MSKLNLYSEGITVLLVDDDPRFLDLLSRRFEEFDDINIEVCGSPKKALDLLSEKEFDCLLSDYDMPEIDGIQLLKQVKDKFPDLPFFIITNKGGEDIAGKAISTGVTDYIQKEGSFKNYNTLVKRIRNAVENRKYKMDNKRILKALETSKEGISILDEEGEFVYVNRAYADLFGYGKSEMRGQHWQDLGIESEPEKFSENIAPIIQEEGKWEGKTVCVKKDGEEFLAQHSLSLTKYGEIICAIDDLGEVDTDKGQKSEEFKDSLLRGTEKIIRQVTRDLVQSSGRKEIEESVCESLAEADHYKFAWIGDIDKETCEIKPRAWSGVDAEYFENLKITCGDGETAQGPTGKAIRTGEIQITQNILEDPEYSPWVEKAEKRGYKSSVAIPLIYQDELYGVLNLYAERPYAFDEEEKELLSELSYIIPYALQNVKDRKRYRRIVEQNLVGIYIIYKGTMEYVNPEFADILGYQPSEIVGRPVEDFVMPEHRDYVRDYIQRRENGEMEGVRYEFTAMSKEGQPIDVEVHGGVVEYDEEPAIMGTMTDITERKQAEEELRERGRVMREMYETISNTEKDFDEKVRKLLRIGRNYLDVEHGFLMKIVDEDTFEVAEMVGELEEGELEDIYPGLQVPQSETYCRHVIKSDSPLSLKDAKEEGYGDDTAYRKTELSCYLGAKVETEDDVYGTICFTKQSSCEKSFTDIERTFVELMAQWISHALTRQRQEEELERVVEDLERSNEDLEQFAYAASHDLRTPLQTVSGYLQILEEEHSDELDPGAEELIEHALNATSRMQRMVKGLLDYSRIGGEIEAEKVDLDSVLTEIQENLYTKIDRSNAEIKYQNLPDVKGDRGQLLQLFQNLIDNAITYSGNQKPEIEVSAQERESEYVIAIEDNGIGIAPEKRDKIFEVFEQAQKNEEGSGIGLASCKKIVQRHGGDIWVESELGEGSTFYFTLPEKQ